MAKIKDNPDSRFLHAEDLLQDGEWKQYTLTIAEVIPPGFKYQNGQTEDQRILKFKEGTGKMLSLSAACNRRIMPFATGTANPENWVGKRITVYAARGNWFSEENLAAVRIRPLPGAKPKLSEKHVGQDLTGTKVKPLVEQCATAPDSAAETAASEE